MRDTRADSRAPRGDARAGSQAAAGGLPKFALNKHKAYSTSEAFTSVKRWIDEENQKLPEVGRKVSCNDFDVSFPLSTEEKLARRLALTDVLALRSEFTSCAAHRYFCEVPTQVALDATKGNLMRLLCPATCGCRNSSLGQMLAATDFGCPHVCGTYFKQSLAHRSCTNLQGDAVARYIRIFRDEAFKLLLAGKENVRDDEGCDFFTSSRHLIGLPMGVVSICDPANASIIASFNYKSARLVCPETCGCVGANPLPPDCPQTCRPHSG